MRIVGGQYAKEQQFPYQVALLRNGIFDCGGSIISDVYILTAAHCLQNVTASRLTVVHGSVFVHGGRKEQVSKIILHKNYTPFIDDIALLKLKKPLKFDKFTKPILLRLDPVPAVSTVIISGFGQTATFQPVTTKLKFNVVVAAGECFDPRIMCLYSDVNNGACFGDSGGPAVYNGQLVGVTSFGIGGCGTENPDGYTKVSYFYNWIIDEMEKMQNENK
jgi:secreted trypsin-like serine protease